MPLPKTKTTITRLTFLLLFIACLIIAANSNSQQKQKYLSIDCPDIGKAKKKGAHLSEGELLLNKFKNRESKPKQDEFDWSITLRKLMNSEDDSLRFDQHNATTIIGYLYDVKPEEGETCNCNSKNEQDHDFHMYLSTKKDPENGIFDCVIIEATPYTRHLHPNWTLEYLQSLKQKKIKVTGWLLYDFKHKGQSFSTNPNTKKRDRRTVWEIHPIINIEETK